MGIKSGARWGKPICKVLPYPPLPPTPPVVTYHATIIIVFCITLQWHHFITDQSLRNSGETAKWRLLRAMLLGVLPSYQRRYEKRDLLLSCKCRNNDSRRYHELEVKPTFGVATERHRFKPFTIVSKIR